MLDKSRKRRPGGGRKKDEASERQRKPWLALGICETTYYRRKMKNVLPVEQTGGSVLTDGLQRANSKDRAHD